jgi:curved DNA-binding protein CbpA
MKDAPGGKAGVFNAFDLLRLRRRPLLAEAEVRAAFQRRAAELHPDAAGADCEADFTALTRAHEILRDPGARLRHLVELEGIEGSESAIPPELAALFPRIAQARQRTDAFLGRRAQAQGVVARALLAPDEAATRRELAAASESLEKAYERAMDDLTRLDAAWPAKAGVAELQARFAFLGKWRAQLREASLRLEIE